MRGDARQNRSRAVRVGGAGAEEVVDGLVLVTVGVVGFLAEGIAEVAMRGSGDAGWLRVEHSEAIPLGWSGTNDQ